MPLFRYFICVGPALLALLYIADARLPRPELRTEPQQYVDIRIKSKVTGPEAVSFSGPAMSYGPAPEMQVVDFAARAAAADVRPVFAQAAPEMSAQAQARPTPSRSRKFHAKRMVARERLVEIQDW